MNFNVLRPCLFVETLYLQKNMICHIHEYGKNNPFTDEKDKAASEC